MQRSSLRMAIQPGSAIAFTIWARESARSLGRRSGRQLEVLAEADSADIPGGLTRRHLSPMSGEGQES
jgi:hypothetical protein